MICRACPVSAGERAHQPRLTPGQEWCPPEPRFVTMWSCLWFARGPSRGRSSTLHPTPPRAFAGTAAGPFVVTSSGGLQEQDPRTHAGQFPPGTIASWPSVATRCMLNGSRERETRVRCEVICTAWATVPIARTRVGQPPFPPFHSVRLGAARVPLGHRKMAQHFSSKSADYHPGIELLRTKLASAIQSRGHQTGLHRPLLSVLAGRSGGQSCILEECSTANEAQGEL